MLRAAESVDSRLLELLQLARVRSVAEERARHARCVVRLVAVGTKDAGMVACAVLAFGRVMLVISREMWARTLIACGGA